MAIRQSHPYHGPHHGSPRSAHQQIQGGLHWCDPLRRSHCPEVESEDLHVQQNSTWVAHGSHGWDAWWKWIQMSYDVIWIRCKTPHGNPIGMELLHLFMLRDIWRYLKWHEATGIMWMLHALLMVLYRLTVFLICVSTQKGSWVVRTDKPSNIF